MRTILEFLISRLDALQGVFVPDSESTPLPQGPWWSPPLRSEYKEALRAWLGEEADRRFVRFDKLDEEVLGPRMLGC
jgi:hypothetical protein